MLWKNQHRNKCTPYRELSHSNTSVQGGEEEKGRGGREGEGGGSDCGVPVDDKLVIVGAVDGLRDVVVGEGDHLAQ